MGDGRASDKAKQFRERAAEARAEAEKMTNPEFRQSLVGVAESYERLATRIEQNEARRKP